MGIATRDVLVENMSLAYAGENRRPNSNSLLALNRFHFRADAQMLKQLWATIGGREVAQTQTQNQNQNQFYFRVDVKIKSNHSTLDPGPVVIFLAHAGAELLSGCTLRLVHGRRYALLGRNGCGKTTLLHRIALGLVPGFPPHLTVALVAQVGTRKHP